eukprot:scaffold244_cov372-Pavlova_lutheri.AAC.8
MFGPCWTRRASVPREEGWNPIYESFRIHTQKTGRNVHGKQDLPPLKQGQRGGVALGCTPGGFESRKGSKGLGHPVTEDCSVECPRGPVEGTVDACCCVGLVSLREDLKSTATGTVGTHVQSNLEPGL